MTMHFKSVTDVLAYVIPFAMRAELAEDDYDLQCQVWKAEMLKQLERLRSALLLLPAPLTGAESLDLLCVEMAWFNVSREPLETFSSWCHQTSRDIRLASIRGEQHEVQF